MNRIRRRVRRIAARAILTGLMTGASLLGADAAAHDFWIHSDRFFLAFDTEATLTLEVGHGPDRQQSTIAARRITRFVALTPDGRKINVPSAIKPETDGSKTLFRGGAAGMYLLVLETDDKAQSHLPAMRFNAYLRNEGLVAAIDYRAAKGLMKEDGHERYSRVAKALIEVGPPGTGNGNAATAAVGLPLEIVLDSNPSMASRPASLPVRVLYQGRPLAGALVKLTNLEHDAAPVETQLADAHGKAKFTMPKQGSWLLNVIWTIPVARGDGIDFETIFSSLSFGVPR